MSLHSDSLAQILAKPMSGLNFYEYMYGFTYIQMYVCIYEWMNICMCAWIQSVNNPVEN